MNIQRHNADRIFLMMIIPAILCGCSAAPKEKSQENSQKDQIEQAKDTEQAPSTSFKLPTSIVKTITSFDLISLPGVVAALPDHSIKITPAIAGKLVAVKALPGAFVKKGQVVATLDDTHLQDQLRQAKTAVETANVNLTQAKNNLTFAADNVLRQKHLFEAEVSAKKEIVLAESQQTNAQSQVQAAQSLLKSALAVVAQNETEIAFTVVHSPISGIVANRYLNIGDTVDPNTPILQIVDLQQVAINAQIATEAAPSVQVGDLAFTEEPYSVVARITSISPMVDASTNTVRVQLSCPNKNHALKDGQLVTVSIKTQNPHRVIVIPRTALVPDPSDPKRQMVYVIEKGRAHRVAVTLRIPTQNKAATSKQTVRQNLLDDTVEVVSGLTNGQTIITKEAYGLPDESVIDLPTRDR